MSQWVSYGHFPLWNFPLDLDLHAVVGKGWEFIPPLGFPGISYGYFENVIGDMTLGKKAAEGKCVHVQVCVCKYTSKVCWCFFPVVKRGRVFLVATDSRLPFEEPVHNNLVPEIMKRLWHFSLVKLPQIWTYQHHAHSQKRVKIPFKKWNVH